MTDSSPETTGPLPGDWVLFHAPGSANVAKIWAAMQPYTIAAIYESQHIKPGELILAQLPDFSALLPPYLDVEATADRLLSDHRDDFRLSRLIDPRRADDPPVDEGNAS